MRTYWKLKGTRFSGSMNFLHYEEFIGTPPMSFGTPEFQVSVRDATWEEWICEGKPLAWTESLGWGWKVHVTDGQGHPTGRQITLAVAPWWGLAKRREMLRLATTT